MAKVNQSEPAAVWVSTDALKPWAGNPRKNDPAVSKVAESIKRFGFSAPIVARKEDGEIIAGHTRLRAAIALGLDKVPVRYLDLDPADAHLLALADNKLNEVAEWDDEALLATLNEFRAQGNDAASVAGFDDAEIDEILKCAGDEFIAPDQTAEIGQRFEVIVDCLDEHDQRGLIERLMTEGRSCRALI